MESFNWMLRDRDGSFQPEKLKKNQCTMSSEIKDKTLALYSQYSILSSTF
jgi:hypothetical protein